MIEVRKGLGEQFFEMLEPQMVVRLVEVPKMSSNAQCLLVELGLPGPERETRLTSWDFSVQSRRHDSPCRPVAKAVDEVRPPGIAEYSVATVSRERVQQRTAEKIKDAPQSPEKTNEAVTLVPRERVQQRTAEQIEEAPQSPEETVEAVTLVPRK